MEIIHQRMEILGGKHRLSKSEDQEFDELRNEFDDLSEHVGRLDRSDELAGASRSGSLRVEAGSTQPTEAVRST
jgi:hypothetical protein